MRINYLHNWQVTVKEARDIQQTMSKLVSRSGDVKSPHLIAGADISSPHARGMARAAVVVLDYLRMNIVDIVTVERHVDFPYVPGLLSFREAPLILDACEKLRCEPDVLLVDGQGIAHPLRIGLASHIGLFLNIPTIGCAKSCLCGMYDNVPDEVGTSVALKDREEVIGAVLRTKSLVKPLYISTGHLINLQSAIKLVLACCRGYRLPEPARLAHQAAGGHLDCKK